LSQLDTPPVQKRGGAGKDCVGSIATHCLEGCIDLVTSVRVVNFDLQCHRTSSSVYILQLRISGTCIGWIDEYAHPLGLGQQITEHFQSLCSQLGSENVDSR
jgi:hypothetical protein